MYRTVHGRGDGEHGVGLAVTPPPGSGRCRHHGKGSGGRLVRVRTQAAGGRRRRHAQQQLLPARDEKVGGRGRRCGVALPRCAVGRRLVARVLPASAPAGSRDLGEPLPCPQGAARLRRLLCGQLVGEDRLIGAGGVAELGRQDGRVHGLGLGLGRLVAEREVRRVPTRLGRQAKEILLHGERVGVHVGREDEVGIRREGGRHLHREVNEVPVGDGLEEDLLPVDRRQLRVGTGARQRGRRAGRTGGPSVAHARSNRPRWLGCRRGRGPGCSPDSRCPPAWSRSNPVGARSSARSPGPPRCSENAAPARPTRRCSDPAGRRRGPGPAVRRRSSSGQKFEEGGWTPQG